MSTSPPPTGRWGLTWRLTVAVVLGAALYGAIWYSRVTFGPGAVPTWLLWVDPVLGVVAVTALLWRRRFPLAVSMLTLGLTAMSSSAFPAALIALVSLATRRRWRELAVYYPVSLAVGVASEFIYLLGEPPSLLTAAVTQTSSFAACAGIGVAIGAQRQTVVTLREQVAAGEREQASRVARAQSAERARIAREMHDTLAHRISLIAVHAGALAYRTDLSREQVHSTAELVRDNADRAVVELREVLGVLRAESELEPTGPQPTLADLPDLLAEARATGEVELEAVIDGQDDPTTAGAGDWTVVPERLSRHTYRAVQEGLTNARKHAPGMPVHIRLRVDPGQDVEFAVRNPAAPYGSAPTTGESSGLGIAGLTERITLAGGRLSAGYARDGSYVLQGSLPWEDR